ncbi:hypothetical protein ACFX2G_047330 [Malus domestica]
MDVIRPIRITPPKPPEISIDGVASRDGEFEAGHSIGPPIPLISGPPPYQTSLVYFLSIHVSCSKPYPWCKQEHLVLTYPILKEDPNISLDRQRQKCSK